MPTWAQILIAFLPTVILAVVGILRVESRLAHLEGQMAAILALFAANLGILGKNSPIGEKDPRFGAPGR
jgi:hypothetical protein